VLLSMWATGDQQQIPSNIRDVKAYPETERERERERRGNRGSAEEGREADRRGEGREG